MNQNNLYLKHNNWPQEISIKDSKSIFGDAQFVKVGGSTKADYISTNRALIKNKGINIKPLPNNEVALELEVKVKTGILNNPVGKQPSLGAIEIKQAEV